MSAFTQAYDQFEGGKTARLQVRLTGNGRRFVVSKEQADGQRNVAVRLFSSCLEDIFPRLLSQRNASIAE